MTVLKILYLTLIFITVNSYTSAQKTILWESQSLGFSVPDNYVVKEKTKTDFIAQNSLSKLSISSFQNDSITKSNISKDILEKQLPADFKSVTDIQKLKSDDYLLYYIEGTSEDSAVFSVIMFDKYSSSKFRINILYPQTQPEIAKKIMRSFWAYETKF